MISAQGGDSWLFVLFYMANGDFFNICYWTGEDDCCEPVSHWRCLACVLIRLSIDIGRIGRGSCSVSVVAWKHNKL